MKKSCGLKLLTIFLAIGSLMALSGCDTIARYSEHFDFGGTISEEESTEHEAGSHPSGEWYGLNSSNYWNLGTTYEGPNFENGGYTKDGVTYFKFYLTDDITISKNFWYAGGNNANYTLCLNGHTLSTTYTDNPAIWVTGGTLNICDCCANGETGGHIKGNDITSTGQGGAIHVEGGTVTLQSGIISESTALYEGGGVYVDSGGTFIMQDGYIMNNTVIGAQGSDDSGGGIYVAGGGTFTMNGGTIKDNSAYNGGGICVAINGTININGGVITDNTATNEGGGILGLADEENHSNSATINMKGNPYISGNSVGYYESNVTINDYVYINLTGEITSGASIGVNTTSEDPGQITTKETSTAYYESAYNHFFADNLEYVILKDDTNKCLTFDNDQAGTVIDGTFKLSFEFYYNGVNQQVPSWGEIKAEGSWDDWAGLEALTEENTGDVYSYYLSLTDITVGRYSCQLVLEYPGQENFEHKITADGDLVFRIPSSSIDTREYTVIVDVYDSFDDILQNSSETENNVQIRIDFTYNGESYKVSDWLLIYLVSDDWTYDDYEWYLPDHAIVLQEGYDEETGSYYYYYNFTEIGVYSYHVQAYAHYNGDHTWNSETEYIGDFYLDVVTTDSGSTITLTLDLEVDLEYEMPDITVDVCYQITFDVIIEGYDLKCPDYGYFVLVGDFSFDTSTREELLEFPLHESDTREQWSNYQIWSTDVIEAVAAGSYYCDIEFRYYDDDYNTDIGTMSIFKQGYTANYYLYNSNDTTVSAYLYNFDYNDTFVDIETTYPDYEHSSISFDDVDDDNHQVGVGGTHTTSVTTTPTDATVTYESSDTSVAYVDSDGNIYGVGLGTAYITATARATGYYKSTATYEISVVAVSSFTYQISILDFYGTTLGEAPEGTILYVDGDYNGTWNTGGWYDWGEEKELTWNEGGWYDLTLDFIPEEGRSFEILAVNEGYGDSKDDRWNHIVGTYYIEGHDMSQIGDVYESIEVSTALGYWTDIWNSNNDDFYVALLDNSGERKEVLGEGYWVGFHAANGVWSGNNWCQANQLMTSANQLAMYSEIGSISAAGTSPWFYVGINNSYMNIEQSNFPAVGEGIIPIYVNYGWMSNDWLNNTDPNQKGDQGQDETSWNATAYGWMYMDANENIADFITNLSWIG